MRFEFLLLLFAHFAHVSVAWIKGFEELARLLSGSNDQTLSPHKGEARFDSENYPVPLVPTEAMSRSRLFGSAPAELIKAITTENITMNNHGESLKSCRVGLRVPEC